MTASILRFPVEKTVNKAHLIPPPEAPATRPFKPRGKRVPRPKSFDQFPTDPFAKLHEQKAVTTATEWKWVEIFEEWHKTRGYLSERQCSILWDIFRRCERRVAATTEVKS